jgi:GNAT superfamily N-acetyltransferase
MRGRWSVRVPARRGHGSAAKEVRVIRLAGAADAAGIRALLESVPGLWDDTWRADVLDRALASAGTTALVSEEDGALVGFACAHDVGFRAYVSALVVSPAARGRGLGARLLGEVERRLAARGCGVVIADVWREAEAFYRSRGWAPPGVVLLRKRLAPGSQVGSAPMARAEPAADADGGGTAAFPGS